MGIPDNDSQLATLEISHSNRLLTLRSPENTRATKFIQQTRNFYGWQILKALETYISPGCLVLDVGANIGNNSVYFAAVSAARVIAYEPAPATADILQYNIESNFLDDKVRIRRVHLSGTQTRPKTGMPIPDTQKANTLGSSSVRIATTLDMERIRDRVDLINVHVEGMSVDVLQGAVGLIMRDRPVIACKAIDRASLDALTAFAVDVGYTFAGRYNTEPTYILVPYRTDLERVRHERQMADLTVQTNILARDLQYRLSLVDRRLTEVEKAIINQKDEPQDIQADLSITQRISGIERRLDEIQNTNSTGLGNEHDGT